MKTFLHMLELDSQGDSSHQLALVVVKQQMNSLIIYKDYQSIEPRQIYQLNILSTPPPPPSRKKMKQESPPNSQQEIEDIISKFRAIIAANGIQISPNFLDSTDPHQINQILKQYSEHSIHFGQKSAQRYIEQVLQSARKNFGLIPPQVNQQLIDKSNELLEQSSSQVSEVVQIKVNKERQIEYDRQILREWKDARIQFYLKSLNNEEDNNKITSQEQIEDHYLQKSKECLPIQSIIRNKIKGLKIIHIEYTSSEFQAKNGLFREQYCYEISAFKLFQVVHENKLLIEVTLKGVMVKYFQDFLERNKAIKDSEDIYLNQQSWIKDFFPLKQLKLSINTIIKFQFPDYPKDLNNFRNLKFFAQLFLWLSDITVKIVFDYVQDNFAKKWSEILHYLFKQLKKIKSIKIQVEGWNDRQSQNQEDDKYDFIRQLFGELSLFTEISSLSFKWIILDQQTTNNYFVAIEQSLDILFSNNSIQNLKLYQCFNFPALPQITTLQSIELKFISFRKDVDFINAILANPSLKFVKFVNIQQQCQIGQQMFDQLQVLSLQSCENIKIAAPTHRTPSNIKYLQFQVNNIEIFDLRTILLKLNNLKYLSIKDIDCKGQVLCTIPSPSLDELHISTNNTLTNQDLLDVDQQWPQLRILTFYKCSGLTEDVWILGNFRGLMKIRHQELQSLQQLRRKGINYL